MKRFRVAHLPPTGASLTLDASTAHHLLHVLRARVGDQVCLFDGDGRQAIAELVDPTDDHHPTLRVVTEHHGARPTHPLHLVLGIPKNAAMDAAVRMATEAGVTHIHPVLSDRSVAKGDRHDRWYRITTSAAQQCGRADVPSISALTTLHLCLGALPDTLVERRIALPGAPLRARAHGPAAVLVGPEGGWTDAEIRTALRHGCVPTGLGRWTFRSDTAAALAVAMIAPLSEDDSSEE